MELKDAVTDLKKNLKSMSVSDLAKWAESNLKGKTFKLTIHDYEWGDTTETTRFEAKEVICSRRQNQGRPEGYSVSYKELANQEEDEIEELFDGVLEVLKLCNYTPDENGVYSAKTAA